MEEVGVGKMLNFDLAYDKTAFRKAAFGESLFLAGSAQSTTAVSYGGFVIIKRPMDSVSIFGARKPEAGKAFSQSRPLSHFPPL